MHTRRRVCAFVVVLFAVSSFAVADGLRKYKAWDQSPEGYFMTAPERTQWDAIRTDDEAEKFVTAFRAARKDGFADEVAKRAALADKYMTIGKLAGSKTLRGRTIIVLGPPTAMNVSEEVRSDTKTDNPSVSGAMSNVGSAGGSGGGNGRVGGGDISGINSISTSNLVRLYHIEYAADPTINREKVDVIIEADPNTGKDLVARRSDASKLNDAMEAAAKSWLRK